MDKSNFKKPSGELKEDVSNEYIYFIPNAPPTKIRPDQEMMFLLSEAERRLGMLSSAGELLPNPHLLINPYIAKEAVLSSKIEGTQASLSDVLKFRAQNTNPANDAEEVSNYIKALEYGLNEIKTADIDAKLIKNMHKLLLENVRGNDKNPGEFRTDQNWIGKPGTPLKNATYVPPAPLALIKCMHDFLNYIQKEDMPLLIQTALMHYHFEAMHPFRDGNGRIGRSLITLYLCKRKALTEPLLYLSAYFEKNREEYYRLLLDVSQNSEYETWIKYFLKGVKEQSQDALERARKLTQLRENTHQKLIEINAINNAQRLVDFFFSNPYLTISQVETNLKVTYPTAKKAVDILIGIGMIEEVTGNERYKMYCAKDIMKIIDDSY